jgi:hypothetical protein
VADIEHTCECCGDPIVGPPAVSAEGDDFCAPCTASLMGAEVKRLREALESVCNVGDRAAVIVARQALRKDES